MYNVETTRFFLRVVGSLFGKQVMELGNQHIWVGAQREFSIPFTVARDWFESQGAFYTSIDLNGQDGAIPLDLSKPIPLDPTDPPGNYDVVTNIGTMEHIESKEAQYPKEAQYQCLRNMHNWCRIGGIMVHALPPVGQWLDHCRIRYTSDFVRVLARLNAYEIIALETTKLVTLNPDVDLIQAAFRKTDSKPFTHRKEELLETIEYV